MKERMDRVRLADRAEAILRSDRLAHRLHCRQGQGSPIWANTVGEKQCKTRGRVHNTQPRAPQSEN